MTAALVLLATTAGALRGEVETTATDEANVAWSALDCARLVAAELGLAPTAEDDSLPTAAPSDPLPNTDDPLEVIS